MCFWFNLIIFCNFLIINCYAHNTTTEFMRPPIIETSKYTSKPAKDTFGNNKQTLLKWLFTGCWDDDIFNNCKKKPKSRPTEYPGYDGWNNNIGRPELGAVDTPLLRRWPAAYEDGVYKPAGSNRPDPLILSDILLNGTVGTKSRTGKNALLVFFGQHVVEEILDAQRAACPPEYFNIKIPKGHHYRVKPGHSEMPVLRTRYDRRTGHSPNNPRQQLNEITPFVDGGLIYGTSKVWSDALRTYSNGTFDPNGLLATSHEDLYPEYNTVGLPMINPPPPIHHHKYTMQHHTEKVDRFFKLGNPRGNENPFLLTFGIIWFRWHNHIASYIRRDRPEWSGEKIYNEARKWVVATQQHIITNEWLPQWLGKELPPYNGYDPSIDPQIDQFFQAAAFRFGHTLVPPGVYLRDYGRNGCSLKASIRTCNNYWMSQNSIYQNMTKIEGVIDVEKLIMGMAVQLCEEEDHKIIEDLRGNLFGPLEFSRRDLMALNIQRGRDHGLPDYNTARMAYNLPKVTNTSHFVNIAPHIEQALLVLHNSSLNNIDVWVGGILETVDGPGELFQTIILDQFQRIRAGDRFWYKNMKNNLFTDDEMNRLELLSFYDILLSVTAIEHDDIPSNPFKVPVSENEIHSDCFKNKVIKKGNCATFNNEHIPCYHAEQITHDKIEKCTNPETYDYFSNSNLSFIITFMGVPTIFSCLLILLYCGLHFKKKKQCQYQLECTKSLLIEDQTNAMFTASEWQDKKLPLRPVIVTLNITKKQIEVKNQLGHMIRAIDLQYCNKIIVYSTHDGNYVMIRVHHNYDLVLQFNSDYLKNVFLESLKCFIKKLIDISMKNVIITIKDLFRRAITKKNRQKKLEQFFRVVFAQAFHIAHREEEMLQVDSTVAREVLYTELTITEFAEALDLRSDSEFVKKIFNLVDKDKNGFISFREFLDMLVIFLKGSAEEKIKLMFDMYDINGTGKLKRDNFKDMLRSLIETVNADVTDSNLEVVIQSMMDHANIIEKETISFQDFTQILNDFNDKLNYTELEFKVNTEGKFKKLHVGASSAKSTFMKQATETMESLYVDPKELQTRVGGNLEVTQENLETDNKIMNESEQIIDDVNKYSDNYWYPIMKYLANKQLQIFWMCLYTLILLGIVTERVYYYAVEQNHSGLRQTLGYGVAITRGAASGMMFTYSTLLVTMSRNTITILRDTILELYLPFDYMIDMHKYIAFWALVFTIIHIIGHGFNFYHISTQTADDLTCLFPNYFHASHELPKFQYWSWGTVTGISGMFLTFITGLIFLSSLPVIRRHFFNCFSVVHSLYPIFYILMILHGAGRMIQEPFFYYFFLGPLTLFVFDKIITMSRKTIELPILQADILPSDVTYIVFPKPPNFEYKSGQWVRIACPALLTNEYHPFTLSSAPHEFNLTVHIRAVGPWTTNIRNKLDPSAMADNDLPMIRIDGPYGQNHQDWHKYDVTIMIGGGIGVTPFASILKDIVYKSNHNLTFGCKKVYFLWVTKTQKQFEWMIDIIRNVESADKNNIVSVHIFITQFYQKFDLRTILLYICERHFQKISNKSLFTGLKAVTHFGRPNFLQFFLSIHKLHPTANKIGVFSCGAPSMTRDIDAACKSITLQENTNVLFQHHFKHF